MYKNASAGNSVVSKLFSGKHSFLAFIVAFAALGTAAIVASHAATNSVTYNGKLFTKSPVVKQKVNTGAAADMSVTVIYPETSIKTLTVAITRLDGTVLQTTTGSSSPLTLHTVVMAGDYYVNLSATGTWQGGAPYSITVNYTSTPASGAASLLPAPIGDLAGWKQIFVDDFNVDAAQGSWATTDPSRVIYTGDHGGQWVTYPDGWPSTYTNGSPGYEPSQVLSVHNGVLDFNLHSINDYPSGANPSPLVTGTSQYQTYGRYEARIRADSVGNYYAAWLLWPQNDANGGCAESDFPEGPLTGTISAFAHRATTCSDYSVQDIFKTQVSLSSGWHIYTQEWTPQARKYYLDGKLVGASTTSVWSQPERWQLQVEPLSAAGSTNGHVYVDWVAVYAYAP